MTTPRKSPTRSSRATRPALSPRPPRPPRRRSLAALLLPAVLTVLAAVPHRATAQPVTPVPLELRVPSPPALVTALGRRHLVYELHVTSFARHPVHLRELTVEDAATGRRLATWSGPELAGRMAAVGAAPGGAAGRRRDDPLRLAPGGRSVAFLWIPFDSGSTPPATLRHRLRAAADGEERTVETRQPVPVAADAPPLDQPPVPAGRWVALRGPSNGSAHRTALVALDGAVGVPQRFAVDWVRLGDDGRPFRGRGSRNEDWYGYGQPVLASRPGRVARVIDGLPEHPPLDRTAAAAQASRATAAGNTVVVDEGDGRFRVYAHLQPGSIPWREGQPVEAGVVLGALGNSGHSLAPHLHVHVASRAEPLTGEGLPFALAHFRLLGRLDSFAAAVAGQPWRPDPERPARDVDAEMPLENMVVEF